MKTKNRKARTTEEENEEGRESDEPLWRRKENKQKEKGEGTCAFLVSEIYLSISMQVT